jgi:TPR repeat protein
VPLDKAQAASLFERSCDGGSVLGCANLADLLAAGDGVPKDEERAAALFRKACDGGHELACRNAKVLAKGGS